MEGQYLSRLKVIFVFMIFVVSSATLIILYHCVNGNCQATRRVTSIYIPHQSKSNHEKIGKHLSFLSYPVHAQNSKVASGKVRPSFEDFSITDFQFDIRGKDVIVFLHIQKTGGIVFGKHLTKDLKLEKPCQCYQSKKVCTCERPNSQNSYWLFSRESVGWKCGVHADWTELTDCVDQALDEKERKVTKRRYFYITLLRNPVLRFLSEYRHIRDGKKWRDSHRMCNGEKWVLPECVDKDTKGISLQQFLNCPNNPAVNRQTRMLADLTLIGCYDNHRLTQNEKDTILLASAKNNLKKMAFFGITELQHKSQLMFEITFNLHFRKNLKQRDKTAGSRIMRKLSDKMIAEVEKANHLDVELYKYAEKLFHSRLKSMKSHFPNVFDRPKSSKYLNWAEIEDLDF